MKRPYLYVALTIHFAACTLALLEVSNSRVYSRPEIISSAVEQTLEAKTSPKDALEGPDTRTTNYLNVGLIETRSDRDHLAGSNHGVGNVR